MFNNDQISSSFWFLIGLLIAYSSFPYGIGKIQSPGAGFFPFFTGIAICLLAGVVFLEATFLGKKGLKWKNPFTKVRWSKPLVAMIALVIYALILGTLGFIVSTALLVSFLLRAIEPQKWLVAILMACLTSLIAYTVFQTWLGTNLPTGIFGF